MKERIILVVSLVKQGDTFLVVRKRAENFRITEQDLFPSNVKDFWETSVQCARRATFEATGFNIKNPKEVGRIKMEMLDVCNDYIALFFLSTELSNPELSTPKENVFWQKCDELKLTSGILKDVIPYILRGMYVSGSYQYSAGDFIINELRDL